MLTDPLVVGVSLKMYFSPTQSLLWCRDVAELARRHPAVTSGDVELFVLPSFLSIAEALRVFGGQPVLVGSQDVSADDEGPFTGEVSAMHLAEIGCRYAEVGHVERRRMFHEDDAVFAAKTLAAVRNGLTPVLCVGEAVETDATTAAAEAVHQLAAILAPSLAVGAVDDLVVAYEPEWAIGAAQPADPEHIRSVCSALRVWLASQGGIARSRVIYGGSAGPGTMTELAGAVSGLFLGRFVHDPAALEAVLDECIAPVLHLPTA